MLVFGAHNQDWNFSEQNEPQTLLSDTEQLWKLLFAMDLTMFIYEFNLKLWGKTMFIQDTCNSYFNGNNV